MNHDKVDVIESENLPTICDESVMQLIRDIASSAKSNEYSDR